MWGGAMPYGHPAGSARTSSDRAPHMPRRRSRRTLTFIVLACVVLWLFGLSRWNVSSFQLLMLTTGGLVLIVFGAVRRRVVEKDRVRVVPPFGRTPQTCVVLRRLGEARDSKSIRWT